MATYDWITFLTDFGLGGGFVGVCHGVIARIAPTVRIIDVSHEISPQAVREGALVLAQSIRYLPRAVHLAIVDPGVGSARRGIAIEAGGSILVGPDNGLLTWAAEALGGGGRAFVIDNAVLQLHPVSRTFHGRDVFAPVAAHLASGVDPTQLGPPLDPGALCRLRTPTLTVADDCVCCEVLLVDRWGNVQLNVSADDLRRAGITPGDVVAADLDGSTYDLPFRETFADVPVGDLLACEDSAGLIALAINSGHAGARLRAQGETQVVLRRRARGV
jgi:S-adenosyl-L-methionine hydrolase (adenosine-forming)